MSHLQAVLAPRVDCDEGMRAVVALEKLGGGGYGWTAICALTATASIVENDVGCISAALVGFDFSDQVL